MPGQRPDRDQPDHLGVDARELDRGKVQRTDALGVLGLEPRGQPPRRRAQDLRPGLQEADVEVVIGVAEGQHRARIRAQVADLDRPGL